MNMKDHSSIRKINGDVAWIGVLDRDIVTFDIVMETQYGTSYNSYFIDAEKKTIIDTTKALFWDEYLAKIQSVVNPADIEAIILNHSEPDHSGNIIRLLELAPRAKVYGSRQAINYLTEMVNKQFPSEIVKDNDTLSLGNKTLRFIAAPNLHWPDTMYTYLEEDKILFTCDSFAAHYCDERMFDDLVGDYSKAFEYYFNVILRPFSKFMVKAIERISPLEISAICTGHGPIIRKDCKKTIEKTRKMAELYLADAYCEGVNILIAYVSAYGFTGEMADTIAEAIKATIDCTIRIKDIQDTPMGELEEMLVCSNALLIGSPTINQNTVLPIYKLFSLINPLRDKGKKAAAFGSYGWSGEAVQLIEEYLKHLKLNVVTEGVSSRFAPGEGKIETLREFGRKFALELTKV
jgi:NADH oxidase (H2O-forming)